MVAFNALQVEHRFEDQARDEDEVVPPNTIFFGDSARDRVATGDADDPTPLEYLADAGGSSHFVLHAYEQIRERWFGAEADFSASLLAYVNMVAYYKLSTYSPDEDEDEVTQLYDQMPSVNVLQQNVVALAQYMMDPAVCRTTFGPLVAARL